MKIYKQLLLTFGAIFLVCLSGNLVHASTKLTNTMSQFDYVYLLKNKGRDNYTRISVTKDKATGIFYLYNAGSTATYGSAPSMTLRVNTSGKPLLNAPDYADVFGIVTKDGGDGDDISFFG